GRGPGPGAPCRCCAPSGDPHLAPLRLRLIGRLLLCLEPLGQSCEIGLNPLLRDSRLKPCHSVEEVKVPVGPRLGAGGEGSAERGPEVNVLAREPGTRRHDADHGKRGAIELDAAPQHRWVAAEHRGPKAMADHYVWSLLVSRTKRAAQLRCCAQDWE